MPWRRTTRSLPQAQKYPECEAGLFPFNIYNRVVDPATLQANADWLKQHPDAHLWIQGYADIRGDIFYNLVLSYRRAQFVKSKLVGQGATSPRSDSPPAGASSIPFARRPTTVATSSSAASISCRLTQCRTVAPRRGLQEALYPVVE